MIDFDAHVTLAESARRSVLGARVRQLREAAGLSQLQLGTGLGYDRRYVDRLESGVVMMSVHTLFKVAGVLSVDPSDLLEGIE